MGDEEVIEDGEEDGGEEEPEQELD